MMLTAVETEPSKRAGAYRETAVGEAVSIPQGLIGFESRQRFIWAEPSDPRFADCRILRSVDDRYLAFLALPLATCPSLVGSIELEEACWAAGCSPENAEWFLIVTPWFADDTVRMTANLRAPLLFDHLSRTARQVVLSCEDLPFHQPI